MTLEVNHKHLSKNEAPDSIEYGKPSGRVKIYGDLSTPEGAQSMSMKLSRATDILKAMQAAEGEQ